MSNRSLVATPGQTVGPFFGYSLPYAGGPHLVPIGHPSAVRLTGRVLDGHGEPVPDALLEIWQADTHGEIVQQPGSLHRDGYTFTGWGRCPSDSTGRYSFTTVIPGPTTQGRPAFIAMTVFARGLLNRLFTRVYVPGQHSEWANDPLLAGLSADRRRTLVAEPGASELIFDVRLQGEDETVFLRYPHQPQ